MKVAIVGSGNSAGTTALARALAVAAIVGINGLFEPGSAREIPPVVELERRFFPVSDKPRRKKPRRPKTKCRKR